MKNILLAVCFAALSWVSYAQKNNNNAMIVGDPADVTTSTTGGALLMGGGTDNDDAMRWMINKSGGGDIVVIRAAGTDAYNDYLYNLAPCNSVETIIINSSSMANDPAARTGKQILATSQPIAGIAYPNPSSGQVNLQLSGINADNIQVSVYSMLGQLVWQKSELDNNISIDLSNLPRGQYLIRATHSAGTWSQKLTLE